MRRSLLIVAAVALFALPAIAADNGFYLGGSIGQTAVNTGTLGEVQVDGNSTGYKVFAGFRMITFLAVEGAYIDFGKSNKTTSATTFGEAKAKGYEAQVLGFIPLGIADIFGKAGAASATFDINGTQNGIPTSISTDKTSPVYGAGVQFRIKSVAVRGEVEYFDVKSTDKLYFYSIGASWTF